MTVRDLIEALQQMSQDAVVLSQICRRRQVSKTRQQRSARFILPAVGVCALGICGRQAIPPPNQPAAIWPIENGRPFSPAAGFGSFLKLFRTLREEDA
jgi:hypothetical protein